MRFNPTTSFAADDTPKIGGYFGETGIHSDFNEIRFGLLSYDTGAFSSKDYDGAVVNGEFLFASPDFLSSIGSPRPYIGFDAAIEHFQQKWKPVLRPEMRKTNR
ncbi:hypothetical protein HED49_17885 [Ochrobactrum daejeonense]|nr:hypothetical protein [Brucella daejeonensis]